ncbi:MAG TPA: DUF982 domain-containing protein [Rhizobiaceae bacterium]|nr:DUF982 domain-containing protein [Rhizobiaceae bacterium]
MNEGWFAKPVPVAIGISGEVHNVSNARQAVDVLAQHWPEEGTQKHRTAHRICLEVLHGMKTPAQAREAFVEAAREADVLIE